MSLLKDSQKHTRNCRWVRAPEDADLGEEEEGIPEKGGGPGRREQEEGEREKRVGGPGEDPLPPLRDPQASEMGVEDTGSLKTGPFIFILRALGQH